MLGFVRWLGRLLAVAAGLAVLYGLAAWAYGAAAAHPFFRDSDERVLVIAHRGGAGLWPENTLYAFRKAVDLGVDVLEMDVRVSADGVPVVIHDVSVDRTTDGSGRVDQLSVRELQRLDAGYRFTSEDPVTGRTLHPFRGVGIRVPTLDEVLEAFPRMRLNIELKPDSRALAASVCERLQRHDAVERTLVVSRYRRVLDAFRADCPRAATAASNQEVGFFRLLSNARLGAVYVPVARALQIPESIGGTRLLSPGLIRAASGRNLDVHVWTVNERQAMERLVAMGADGIITDYPDRLRAVLGR